MKPKKKKKNQKLYLEFKKFLIQAYTHIHTHILIQIHAPKKNERKLKNKV